VSLDQESGGLALATAAPHAFVRLAPPSGSTWFTRHPGSASAKIREKAVCTPGIPQGVLEQYRKLAASLHHSQAEHGTRIIMMASTLASEGKTLTATNLALTLSESYRRRVLLIDADLRRPTVQLMFDLPNVSGLNDALHGDEDARCSIFDVSTHLSILTAGRPNQDPMSGLTSDRMRRLITAAATEFDWVIIDTPPVGILPDANLLAAMVDTVILVVAAGGTPFRLVNRAVEAIGRDRIFGVVLNKVHAEDLWGGYSSYSYYGYGTQDDQR